MHAEKFDFLMKNITFYITTILLLFSGLSFATDYYSQGSGNWSTLSNWNTAANGSGIPPALASEFSSGTNSFYIQDGHNITLETNINIVNLEIGDGKSGKLTFGNGTTSYAATVSGDILVDVGAIMETYNGNSLHTLTFSGSSFTNNGTMTNMYRNSNRYVSLILNSNAFCVIGGANLLEFGQVTLDGQGSNGVIQTVQRIQVRREFTIQNTAQVSTNARWDLYRGMTLNSNCAFNASNSLVYSSGNRTFIFNEEPQFSDLYIDNGTVTVTGNFTVDDYFYIYSDGAIANTIDGIYTFNDEIRVQNGGSFDLTGELYLTGTYDGASYINPTGGGSIDFDGINVNITGNTTCRGNSNITINNGSIRVTGGYFNINSASLEHSVGMNTDTFLVSGTNTVYLRGTDNFPDGFDVYDLGASSWIEYDLNGMQQIRSAANLTYANLRVDRSTKTADGNLDIDGRLAFQNGAILNLGGYSHTFAGSLMSGNGTLNSTGTVTFDAANANQEIDPGPTYNFENLIFTQTAPTAGRIRNIDTDINVNGNFTATNTGGSASNYLRIDVDANVITNDGTGTFSLGDHVRFRASGATNFGDAIGSFSSTTLSTQSIVWLDGTNQEVPGNNAPVTFNGQYGHLYFSGNGTKTPTGTLSILGNIRRQSGTPVFSDAGFSHTVTGDWSLLYAYTSNMTGTITFNGADQTISQSHFNNVNFSGTDTKSIIADIRATGTINTASGVNVVTDDLIELGGDFNVTGTGQFQQTNESIQLNGASDQTISINDPSNSFFNNFTINNSGGTISTTSGFTVAGNFILTANAGNFDLNGQTVNIGNDWDINTGCTFAHNNGTLHFNGDLDQNLYNDAIGIVYYNLEFSGTSEKQLLSQDWDVDGSITINSTTLDQGYRQINIAGDWINNSGTFQGTDRTIFDGGNQSIDASDFHDLYAGGTNTKTLNGSVKCTGDLRIQNGATLDAAGYSIEVEEQWFNHLGGSYTHNNGKVIMIGNASQIYSGGTGIGNRFYDLEINLATPTQSLDLEGANINVDGDLNIIQGIVRSEGRDLFLAGDLTVTGELNINSNSSVITFDASTGSHSFLPGSTSVYRDIIFNASGANYSLAGDLTIESDRTLTISNGTFDINHNDLQLQGSSGNLSISAGGTLEIDSLANLIMGSGGSISNSGGIVRLVGTQTGLAGLSASTGSFTFVQTSGTFHGLNYTVSGIAGNGLDFQGGAIDATNNLSYGTYTNGTGTAYINVVGGTYSAPVTFNGTVFNDNAGSPTFNCVHTSGQQFQFISSSGTRSGFVYEQDDLAPSASSGLIQWTYPSGTFWVGTSGGGDGTSWEDGQNWSSGTSPSTATEAIIDHSTISSTINIDIDAADAACAGLTLDAQGGNPINITLNGRTLAIGTSGVAIGSGTSLSQSTSTDSIFVAGDWANAGTFNEGNSVVVFNDTSGTHTITTNGLADPFNHFLIQGAGEISSATYQLGSAIQVDGNFSLVGGSLDVVSASNEIVVSGDWLISEGSTNPRDGTVTFNDGGTGNQTINGGSFYDLILSNGTGSGTNTKIIPNNIEILDDITINANTAVSAGTTTLFVKDEWINNSTLTAFSQTGTGTVIFNGDVGTQTIGGSGGPTTFNNIYLQGANDKIIAQDMDVNGDFYVISGIGLAQVNAGVTINGIGSNNEFNQTGGNFRIVGTNGFPQNFESINISGGEVQYQADIDQTISPATYYFLRLKSNTGVPQRKTASGSFTVKNCLDMDDDAVTTLDMNDSTFTLSGNCWRVHNSGPAVMWGTPGGTGTFETSGTGFTIDAGVSNFNNVIIDGTGTKTIGTSWTMDGNLTIRSASTLNMSSRTITCQQSGKSMTMSNNSIIRANIATPDTAFPTAFSSYNLDQDSEVDVNGTNVNIYTSKGNLAYGKLRLDNTGTATVSDGDLNVDGDFDQNAGLMVDNGFDVYFGGPNVTVRDFTPTTGTTQYFDGGDQYVNDDGGTGEPLNYYHLIFDGTGTKTIANDVIDALGNTTIQPGVTVDINANSSFAGNFTNNGILDASVGIHTFDGSTAQTIDPGSNHEFYAIEFDNGGSFAKTILNTGLDIGNGDFIIQNDATVDFGALTHTLASLNFNIDGGWNTTSANLTFDRNGTQYLPELIEANHIHCSGSGTKILQGNWQSVNDVTIDNSVFLDANNTNDYDINLRGNWLNSGGFYDREGTVSFESDDAISKTITTNGSQFYNLNFNQNLNANRTYTLTDNLTINEDIIIGSGANFDLNGQTLTVGTNDTGNPAGESVTVEAGGTLTVGPQAIIQFNTVDTGGYPRLDIDGSLNLVGDASNVATITREAGSGYIETNITGSLNAQYYSIQYLDDNGLNMTSTSTLDQTENLSDGSFSNIRVNNGSTYITIESDLSTHSDSIRNITFDHSGTPVIGNDFNVTRLRADGGFVRFASPVTGALAGDSFDNDPNGDTRITWPTLTATTWTAGASTSDWFTSGNWDNGVPTALMDVIIPLQGLNPIIDGANADAKSITVSDGYLRLNNGFNLTVASDFTIGSTGSGIVAILHSGCQISVGGSLSIGASGVFSHGNGTIEMTAGSGSVSLQTQGQNIGNLIFNGAGTFTISDDLNITGDVTIVDGTVSPGTNNYAYSVAGNWNGSGGTFLTSTNGTVSLNGNGTQEITTAQFDNLIVDGTGNKAFNGSVVIDDEIIINSAMSCTLGATIDFNDNVTINLLGTFDDGGETHTFAGVNWTNNGTYNVNTGQINFDRASGTQNIFESAFNNLSFIGGSRIELEGNISLQGDLEITNSINTFRCGEFSVSNLSGAGTFTLESGESIYCSGTNSYPSNFSTYSVNSSSNTYFDGTSDQNIIGGAQVVYGNLILTQTSTKTLSGDINVDGYLDINNTTLDANDFNINLAGDWRNYDNGSFIYGTGELIFDQTLKSPQYINGGNPANGAKSLGNIRIQKAIGYSVRVTGENLDVNGYFILGIGEFHQNGYTVNYGDYFNVQSKGTYVTSGTTIFDKSSGTANIWTTGETLNNVEFVVTAGTTWEVQDDFNVNGNFSLGAGSVFDGNGNNATFGNGSNSVSIDGEYIVGAGGSMKLASNGQVVVSSTGVFEAVGTSGNSAIITREATGRYNFTVDGTIKCEYYTFEFMGTGGILINSGATIDATNNFSNGAFSNPASGGTCLRIENNQSFTGANRIENVSFPNNPGGGASNVTKTSTATGSLEFFTAIGEFSGEDFDSDPNNLIDWTGELVLTWNGSLSTDWYNPNNWTPSFGPNIIPNSTVDATIPFIVVQPFITSEGAEAKTLTIENGSILEIVTSDSAIPDLALSGDLNLNGLLKTSSANDSITVAGNWTRASTGTLNMDVNSSVSLVSTGATVFLINGSAATLPNLHINVSGSAVLGDDILVGGDLHINSGTLDVSSNNYDVNLKGSFLNNSNFEPSSGTVILSGTSGGTVDLGGDPFYNAQLDAGAGTYSPIGSTFEIDHIFTITSGTFLLNGFTTIIGENNGNDDALNINGGTFTVDANSNLKMGRNSNLNVNNGGTLTLVGNDLSNLAYLSNNGLGRYNFNVNSGGEIHAKYFETRFVNSAGIYIRSGATIDAVNNFSFGHIANTPSSGTMLRIENDQNLTGTSRIEYLEFEGNGSITNCTKTTTSSGDITFYWAYGTHQGEASDSDPNNLIDWGANLIWTGGSNSNWSDSDNWDNDITGIANTEIPSDFTDVTIPSAGVTNEPTLSGSNNECANCQIESGRTVTWASGARLNVNGDFNNSGNINLTDGELGFTGSDNQTLTSSTLLTLKDLTLNNGNNLQLISGPFELTGSLEIPSGTLQTNGLITLLSDASGTGRIGEITGSSISGDITMERHIPNTKRQWRYIATPFTNTTVDDWQENFPITGSFTGSSTGPGLKNDPSLYWYNETLAGSTVLADYDAYPTTDSTAFIQNGRGYSAYFRQTSDITLSNTGTVKAGNMNFGLTYTTSGNSDGWGWNLIGNPYPSQIDWDASSGWSKANVDNAIYFTDNETGTNISYVAGISIPPGQANGVISSGQAFWVHAANGSGSLQSTEQVKTTATQRFYKGETEISQIKITVFDEPHYQNDMCILHFQNGATAGYDKDFDAKKHFPTMGIGIYSTIDDSKAIINGNALDLQEYTFNLIVENTTSGFFDIEIDGIDEFFFNYEALLIEEKTGRKINLKAPKNQLRFYSNGSSNEKFKLILTKKEIVTSTSSSFDPASERPILFPNPCYDGTVNLLVPTLDQYGTTLTLFNAQGVKCGFFEISQKITTLELPESIATGFYSYSILSNGIIFTGKLDVKK